MRTVLFRNLLRALPLLFLSCAPHAMAFAATEDEVEVTVQVKGGVVHVDVSFVVAAAPAEVWEVLTDFSHMQEFVSNLNASLELSRADNLVLVAQKGRASVGPLSFEFESVREIQLAPFELIRTRQIGGNLKKFEGRTQLSVADGRTLVRHHSESIPDVWIPPLIGRQFILGETREQFAEIRQEILRRKRTAERH